MAVTIATHMGHKVARQHNMRNRKVTDRESHIDKGGDCAVWADMSPQVAYQKLFGKAVDDYNAKQSRSDRQISNYYQQVCKDAKKHAVYECIVGVYPQEGQRLTKEQQKAILLEYAQGWKKANPNLALIGCYWHADERGEPHIHLDYIPWSDGYKNGPKRQAGLVRALESQGYHKQGRETAQMQWTRAENNRLESICKKHGLEVVHPLRGKKSKHIATEDYKYHKDELTKLQKQIMQTADYAEQMLCQVEQFQHTEDVFQWMENRVNPKGQTMFELYCDSQNLDYEYWVEATHIEPNPAGSFGGRTQGD